LLLCGSPTIASGAAASNDRTGPLASHCHWCGRRCPDLVRQGFMRRRGRRQGVPRLNRTGRGHGDTT
jgi:hypothetical protein